MNNQTQHYNEAVGVL